MECDEWGKPIRGESRMIKVRWTRISKEGSSLAGRVETSMKSLANAEVLTDDPNISVGDVLVFESKKYTVADRKVHSVVQPVTQLFSILSLVEALKPA